MKKRRATAVAAVTGLLLATGVAPASAAGLSHGYCGHATSVNWITGWAQTFNWHTTQNGNRYHSVQHNNQNTGEGPYWDLHDCD